MHKRAIQSSNADSLGLGQLETLFYSICAIGLIGFAIVIGEILRKVFSIQEALKRWKIIHPLWRENIPFQTSSSKFMLILSQTDSESKGIFEQKLESGGIL